MLLFRIMLICGKYADSRCTDQDEQGGVRTNHFDVARSMVREENDKFHDIRAIFADGV